MKKVYVNYLINIGLIVSFVLCFFTGIIKWPGLHRFIDMRGFPLVKMSIVHDWSGLIMGILVLFHIILNFKFMIIITKKLLSSFGRQKT